MGLTSGVRTCGSTMYVECWIHRDLSGANGCRSRSQTRTNASLSRYASFPAYNISSNSPQSPAKNILVENIYCNWSGGCAMGSLGTDTDISDIVYRNVYTWKSNQMYMIKSNGGSGTVSNLVLENFIGMFLPRCSREMLTVQATETRTRWTLTPNGAA